MIAILERLLLIAAWLWCGVWIIIILGSGNLTTGGVIYFALIGAIPILLAHAIGALLRWVFRGTRAAPWDHDWRDDIL